MLTDGFSLEFEWQQVSSSLQDTLRILAVLSNAVIWIVSTRPPTSKSSRPFNNPSVIVPNAPITIGTIVTFMLYSFFQFSSKVQVLILFSHSFRFILWFARTAKSTILQILFFIDNNKVWSSRPRLGDPCVCQRLIGVYVSYPKTGAGLCIYHLLVWLNLNFLHIFQWITFPTQSCLALYSFCANLLHSLITWLIVSSLSPHSDHLLFCCV